MVRLKEDWCFQYKRNVCLCREWVYVSFLSLVAYVVGHKHRGYQLRDPMVQTQNCTRTQPKLRVAKMITLLWPTIERPRHQPPGTIKCTNVEKPFLVRVPTWFPSWCRGQGGALPLIHDEDDWKVLEVPLPHYTVDVGH